MKMKALLLTCVALVATTANAGTVQYQMAINGDNADLQLLPAGTYDLAVLAMVSDNDIQPGAPGGLLLSSFNLGTDTGAIQWEQGSFLGNPNGKWASTANAALNDSQQGIVTDEGKSVVDQSNGMLAGDWDLSFNAVAADVWSIIVEGKFEYDGTPNTLLTLSTNVDVLNIAVVNAAGTGIGAAFPEVAVGDTILIGIPEPATLALSGLAMVGLFTMRRRSC